MRIVLHAILDVSRALGQGTTSLDLPEGATLRTLTERLQGERGELLTSVLFVPGTCDLLPHVRVLVNGRQAEFLNGIDTRLEPGDEVTLLPLVAGG